MADMAWPDAIRCEAKRSDALLRDVLKTQWENCGNCGNSATTDQRLSNISLSPLALFLFRSESSWPIKKLKFILATIIIIIIISGEFNCQGSLGGYPVKMFIVASKTALSLLL